MLDDEVNDEDGSLFIDIEMPEGLLEWAEERFKDHAQNPPANTRFSQKAILECVRQADRAGQIYKRDHKLYEAALLLYISNTRFNSQKD